MSPGSLHTSAYLTQTRRYRASSLYFSNLVSSVRSSRVHRSSSGKISLSRPPAWNVCSAHLMKQTHTSSGSSPLYVESACQNALEVMERGMEGVSWSEMFREIYQKSAGQT